MIHYFTTALSPLTGEVNNIDHPFTMQCFAGILCILAFMLMVLDVHHPANDFASQVHPPMTKTSPSGTMCPTTTHEPLENSSKNMTEFKVPTWPLDSDIMDLLQRLE